VGSPRTFFNQYRFSILLGLGVLFATLGCGTRAASSSNRVSAHRPTEVAKHFIVLVSEDDEQQRDASGNPLKRDSLVLGEPLDAVRDRSEAVGASAAAKAEAFSFKNGNFNVGIAWDRSPTGARCLDVSVVRSGDPRMPDFRASGCVPTSGPSARVAKIDRVGGGSIEVIVWFFDGPAHVLPPPSLEGPPAPLPNNSTET
jgi:hypothetical protein